MDLVLFSGYLNTLNIHTLMDQDRNTRATQAMKRDILWKLRHALNELSKKLCRIVRIKERIGHRIRKIREEKNISRAQLGALVGLSADRIQQYENGSGKPRIDLLKKILNEYHSWEWTYPQALIDESNKAMKKARLKSKIQELQEEIKKTDDDE